MQWVMHVLATQYAALNTTNTNNNEVAPNDAQDARDFFSFLSLHIESMAIANMSMASDAMIIHSEWVL